MELPEDVVHKEILTRIPIKSVSRFRCVSKSWLSLFSNSQFIKDHRNRSTTQNLVDYDYLVTKKYNNICMLSRYKETVVRRVYFSDYELIGSLHGLLCLHNSSSVSLLLWNPAIHQAKELTLPLRSLRVLRCIGFGFDPANNDYKVVVCCLYDGRRYGYVYSFNSSSWNDLFIPRYVYPRNIVRGLVGPTAIVKDCPYWKYSTYSPDKRFKYVFVVKFDLGSNEFKLLPKFRSSLNNNNGLGEKKRFKFVNMKDHLILMVFAQNYSNLMVDVYSLDEEERSWIQSTMYSISFCNTRPWDVVSRLTQGFEQGGEIVFQVRGKFFCYDPETKTIKHILNEDSCFSSIRRCYRYTPSLVFLQGMKSVRSQTLSHIFGY